ncbi:hypothetical protein [Variovorax paradoxus]|uniref:hypothetical protein n=1 Tax=Variovorax paradoxus TaxID=34073 RepID=UPI003F5129BA
MATNIPGNQGMTDKLDKYTDALTALLHEAIRCSPESWTRGVLTIDCDGSRINYGLKSDQSGDRANISQDLAQLCEQYWAVFQEHGEAWLESTIEFYQEGGAWKFNANYKRPEKARATSKPSWKFWQ